MIPYLHVLSSTASLVGGDHRIAVRLDFSLCIYVNKQERGQLFRLSGRHREHRKRPRPRPDRFQCFLNKCMLRDYRVVLNSRVAERGLGPVVASCLGSGISSHLFDAYQSRSWLHPSRLLKGKRQRHQSDKQNRLPLPLEIVDEITSYLSFLELWEARTINRTFRISCLDQIRQRYAESIVLGIEWKRKDGKVDILNWVSLPATLNSAGSHSRLTWSFDMLSEKLSRLREKSGQATLSLNFNKVRPSQKFLPMKPWIKPRLRWPGDLPLPPSQRHLHAVWFDGSDETLAAGIIELQKTTICYVFHPYAFEVSIYLAEIIGFMKYASKFKSSKDFVLHEVKFSIMF